jgi:hypothetical protein
MDILNTSAFMLLFSSPALGYFAAYHYNRVCASSTTSWNRTRGLIEYSDVRIQNFQGENDYTRYFVDIRYAYAVGVKSLRNDEIWLNSTHEMTSYKEAEDITGRYFEGRDVTVYYDRNQSERAVLELGFHAEGYAVLKKRAFQFTGFALLLISIFLAMILLDNCPK